MIGAVQKSLSAVLFLALVLAAISVPPSSASGEERSGRASGASGRQIASVVGVAHTSMPGKVTALRHTGKKSVSSKPQAKSAQEWLSLREQARTAVQNAADKACEAARWAIHTATEQFQQLGQWMGHIYNQANALPVATPGSGPYTAGSARFF